MAATQSQSAAALPNGYDIHLHRAHYLDRFQRDFTFTLETIENLFLLNEQLSNSLENALLDGKNNTQIMRDLRKEVEDLKNKLEQTKIDLSRNPYSLVLVDGDGMTFRRELLKEGRAGGEKAADRLTAHVQKDTGLKPVIRIFANVEGLSRAMKTQGLIQTPSGFREFTVGVSDPCRELVDFIDVGEGKEMADTKLKSELEWHLKNYNCRKIILGVSHDNGYARILKKYENEPEILQKIQLLEGPPFGRELEALHGFTRIKYEDVFSSEKFDVYQQRSPVLPLASPISPIAKAPVTSYAAAVNAAPTITPPSSTGHGSPRPSKAQLQFSESQIQEAIRKIKRLQPRPCNNHYLKGECNYGDDECTFGHKYPLKQEELQAMRRLALQKPCNFGRDCINEKCYYSHDD